MTASEIKTNELGFDQLKSQFPGTTLKETKDYINKNWNKI